MGGPISQSTQKVFLGVKKENYDFIRSFRVQNVLVVQILKFNAACAVLLKSVGKQQVSEKYKTLCFILCSFES